MKLYDPRAAAAQAVTNNPSRPATALLHDSADARVVMFRIESGQQVPVHTSTSTVLLVVVSGTGTVAGGDSERRVGPGDIIAYDPREPHGMRADGEQLVIAAIIAPRPGSRA
jgi:quercetin dioxygenase-like cupin family protein